MLLVRQLELSLDVGAKTDHMGKNETNEIKDLFVNIFCQVTLKACKGFHHIQPLIIFFVFLQWDSYYQTHN